MIRIHQVYKNYYPKAGKKEVLKNISFSIKKGERIGILGKNGVGKSTLIRLLSGVESPSAGEIVRNMSISWPIAFSGAFQGSLTGMDNLRFICRLYRANFHSVKRFTEEFAELGDYLYEPVKTYSSGMRARLAFALSLAIEFDCYLIDEVVAVGDERFKRRCQIELFEKRCDRAIILVSHNPNTIRQWCDKALVLENGFLYEFKNIDEAYAFYNGDKTIVPLPHTAVPTNAITTTEDISLPPPPAFYRKLRKLYRHPHAFFQDSQLSTVRKLGKLFRKETT